MLFVWGFRESQLSPATRGGSTIPPQIVQATWERDPGKIVFTGTMPEYGHVVIVEHDEYTMLYTHFGEITDPAEAHLHFSVQGLRSPASTIKPFWLARTLNNREGLYVATIAAEDAVAARSSGALDLPGAWRAFWRVPTIIFQVAPEGGTSPGKGLLYWLQVFGIFSAALTAFTGQVMMWIALHRKRSEALLLRLDIEKRKLEIEQLKVALEQARAKSG